MLNPWKKIKELRKCNERLWNETERMRERMLGLEAQIKELTDGECHPGPHCANCVNGLEEGRYMGIVERGCKLIAKKKCEHFEAVSQ
jgi:hypothetical protein